MNPQPTPPENSNPSAAASHPPVDGVDAVDVTSDVTPPSQTPPSQTPSGPTASSQKPPQSTPPVDPWADAPDVSKARVVNASAEQRDDQSIENDAQGSSANNALDDFPATKNAVPNAGETNDTADAKAEPAPFVAVQSDAELMIEVPQPPSRDASRDQKQPTKAAAVEASTPTTTASVAESMDGDSQSAVADKSASDVGGDQNKDRSKAKRGKAADEDDRAKTADDFEPGEVPFASLPLAEEVRRAVELAGYRTATAIQSAIIGPMVDRRDVLAQSQTGSGKTAAFALPVLTNLDTRQRAVQCLVLTPTRELAMQVSRSFTGYGEEVRGLNVTAIYGGQDYQPQLRSLKRGSQVVVGTPGRVIDHIKRGTLDLSQLQTLVLDEADEMLNMGFLDDVEFVLQQTPADRQIALFSATMPGPIAQLSKRYLNDPVRVSIDTQTLTADSIRQRAVFVPPRDKLRLLKRFLETEETEGVIVFVKTRDATVTLAESLARDGFSATAINGDMPQNVRERTISQLKSGRLDVLVATDVAARGLDVQRISHVFNFDLPHDSESYVHRVGRTGRAGRAGEAIIFLSNSQRHRLRTIQRVTGQEIEVVDPPPIESVNRHRAEAFANRINETIAGEDLTMLREMIADHAKQSGQSLEDIAAALAHINQRGRPFFLNEDPIAPARGKRDRDSRDNDGGDRRQRRDRDDDDGDLEDRRERRGKRFGPPEGGMVRYRLAVGRRDNIHVGNIVGAVANEAGLSNREIGPIRIHESFSTIDLPEGMPGDVFQTLRRTRVGGRPLSIREWTDSPPKGRPGKKFGKKPSDGKFAGPPKPARKRKRK